MARAILLALVLVDLADGSRYVDYGGVVKMPQYGVGGADYEGPRDEYNDHSTDLVIAHEYSDEDEPIGKTDKLVKVVDETEVWQKSTVKYKRQSTFIDDGDVDTLDKYSPEEMVNNFKSNNRIPLKHRTRLKIRDFDVEPVTRRRPAIPRGVYRHKIDDRERKDDFEELNPEDTFHENKHGDFKQESMQFNRRTTAKIIRRKPRDRYQKIQVDDEDILGGDGSMNLGPDLVKDQMIPPGDYQQGSDNEFRKRVDPPRRTRLPGEREDLDRHSMMEKSMGKKYSDYSDYYDMKRVESIKNQLPIFFRKTSGEGEEPTRTSMERTTTFHLDEKIEATTASLPDSPLPLLSFRTEEGSSSTRENVSPTNARDVLTTPANTKFPTPKHLQEVPLVKYSTTATIRIKELPLAEKSRLSVLKKAQKKLSGVFELTSKPPVLLQVKEKTHTVIMVEAPTSQNPWTRVRVVTDESPENLVKVKHLMRQKL